MRRLIFALLLILIGSGASFAQDHTKAEQFVEKDPTGIIMTLTAMVVVFSALIVLFLLFKLLGRFMVRLANHKEARLKALKNQGCMDETAKADWKKTSYSGEVVAAIAVAMKLYEEDYHDLESQILTINKVTRTYSPWSSKIYGLRQIPNKK